MSEKIIFKILNIKSENDKKIIETEITKLTGIEKIAINAETGSSRIDFNPKKISLKELAQVIKSLGFQIGRDPDNETKKEIYFIEGMHCASCEIIIEKKLLNMGGVEFVNATSQKNQVTIEYKNKKPNLEKINQLFKEEGYLFLEQQQENDRIKNNKLWVVFITSLVLILGFLFLERLGLSGLVNVSSKSSLFAFFVLGLVAGISSCAALVGGIILSMSKQWLEIYSNNTSFLKKLEPHLMFNVGRIISYGVFGAILGGLGSQLQISLKFTSFLTIIVSFLMIFLALQMLGFKKFRKFQISLPKLATRYISNESNFKGRQMPFLMGALTFFLPCGFTITAQGLALLSGSPLQGGLIMIFFALGTAPSLLFIGLSTVKFFKNNHKKLQFSKIAGILVLFFAFFNINNQLTVLGYYGFGDLSNSFLSFFQKNLKSENSDDSLAPIVNGKQLLKMDASSYGYSPNYFKVKLGIPVRWEITDQGTSGCTNAVISKNLFAGQIALTRGQTSIKEFTPTKPGKYKFSCWMGMISGIIEVID